MSRVWFTCRSTDSAVDFVATEPAADQAFTLQERERGSGKVVHEYALTEGEGSAGAGSVFTAFLQNGKDFGALRSVQGELLDPPVRGTVPSELRIGDRSVTCERPGAPQSLAVKLSATTILGTWSFDGSCASDDGMILQPDGAVSFSGGGEGQWKIAADNQIALSLQVREMGDENARPEPVDYSLQVTQLTSDRLVGTLIDTQGKEQMRPIDAKRCVDSK